MSITTELRASARSTYRLLFRAAATTFQGDDRLLNAFQDKLRKDFKECRSAIDDPEEYAARIQLGREIADVLRKNVVQAVKVDPSGSSSSPLAYSKDWEKTSPTARNEGLGGTWRLRLTKDTELGSNESIKSSQSTKRQTKEGGHGCCQSPLSSSASASTSDPFSPSQSTTESEEKYFSPVKPKTDEVAWIESLRFQSKSEPEDISPMTLASRFKTEPFEARKADPPKCVHSPFRSNHVHNAYNPRSFPPPRSESESELKSLLKSLDVFGPRSENADGDASSDTGVNSQKIDQKSRNINFSTLKRLSQERVKPELKEEDIEESFVRGSGPGGQSINKTSNNVQLLHKPTGIRVTCQETRSLQTNRTIARKKLLERLDRIANPGLSKEEMKRAKQVERERRRKKAKRKKERVKAALEEAFERFVRLSTVDREK
ncbi:hypothetical protein ACEPAF_4810 [Sanghuangporus sanghuang]